MANCPNCGAPLQKNGVCAACGYTCSTKPEDVDALLRAGKFAEASIIVNEELEKDENNGKACLDSVRIQTKNFSEKPADKDKCLETAVRGLTYASDKDKANCEFKLLAYFENLNLGGRGVENVFDIKSSVSGNVAVNGKPGVAGHAAGGAAAGAAGAAAAKSSKKGGLFSKLRKPMSKKGKIITLIVSLVLVGAMIGIIVGVNSSNGGGKEKYDPASPTSNETYITLDKQNGYGGDSYVYGIYGEYLRDIVIPTRDGYDFTGYYDEYDSKYIDEYGRGYRYWYNTSSTATLYAHWEAKTPDLSDYLTFNTSYSSYRWTYDSSNESYSSYQGLSYGYSSTMSINVKRNCTFRFDYDLRSYSNSGYFKIIINSSTYSTYTGNRSGYTTLTLHSSDYVLLTFDQTGSNRNVNDKVTISNLQVYNV